MRSLGALRSGAVSGGPFLRGEEATNIFHWCFDSRRRWEGAPRAPVRAGGFFRPCPAMKPSHPSPRITRRSPLQPSMQAAPPWSVPLCEASSCLFFKRMIPLRRLCEPLITEVSERRMGGSRAPGQREMEMELRSKGRCSCSNQRFKRW